MPPVNQGRLFGPDDFGYEPMQLVARDGAVTYDPYFLEPGEADALFRECIDTVAWRQDHLRMYGRSIPLPRLTAWYGDEHAGYRYSGIENTPLPWLPGLASLREKLAVALGVRFNSVLLNRYRYGTDSLSWHSDDEPELGPAPLIASISLGTVRTFQLQHKVDGEILSVALDHGSLLVMSGETQRYWKHQIPKERGASGERINATFRIVSARSVYQNRQSSTERPSFSRPRSPRGGSIP